MVSEESKIYAFIGIVLTIIGYVIIKISRPKDDYAMYYANQGLVLGVIGFIFGFVFSILIILLFHIPLIGFILGNIFSLFFGLLWIGLFVLWVVGIIFSLSGEKKEIPVIGDITNYVFK